MLELHQITLKEKEGAEDRLLLNGITLSLPGGHFTAIIGPSGCGKSKLFQVVAGLRKPDSGDLAWDGRSLLEKGGALHPSEVGFLPAHSEVHSKLTVKECLAASIALRTTQPDAEAAEKVLVDLLSQVNLTALIGRPVGSLSLSQRRRLTLATELVTDPTLLVCHEITHDLDAKAEQEMIHLLHELSRKNPRRLVLHVTSHLQNLSSYDTIILMHEGGVVYHGPPRALAHYFSTDKVDELYTKLARRSADRWADSWNRHRDAYYRAYRLSTSAAQAEPAKESISPKDPGRLKLPTAKPPSDDEFPDLPNSDTDADQPGDLSPRKSGGPAGNVPALGEAKALPSVMSQTKTLLHRRWLIFKRERGWLWTQIALIVGLPLFVALLGYEAFSNTAQGDAAQGLWTAKLARQVSALVFFEVMLVIFMAVQTALHEMLLERPVSAREQVGGVRISSFLLSKGIFLGIFVLLQALWMGLFVEMTCQRIPGDMISQFSLLVLVSAAVSALTLGLAANIRKPGRAGIWSLYLLGLQIPLSGAILALPPMLALFVKPFIPAYWSWAGSLDAMKDSSIFDEMTRALDSPLVSFDKAVVMLVLHLIVGLALAAFGLRRSRSGI